MAEESPYRFDTAKIDEASSSFFDVAYEFAKGDRTVREEGDDKHRRAAISAAFGGIVREAASRGIPDGVIAEGIAQAVGGFCAQTASPQGAHREICLTSMKVAIGLIEEGVYGVPLPRG